MCAQEIGDKEAEIRAQQEAAVAAEAEQAGLEAKRNGLNDQRKELWRTENDAEAAAAKMKADKQKADKKVRDSAVLMTSLSVCIRIFTAFFGNVCRRPTRSRRSTNRWAPGLYQ